MSVTWSAWARRAGLSLVCLVGFLGASACQSATKSVEIVAPLSGDGERGDVPTGYQAVSDFDSSGHHWLPNDARVALLRSPVPVILPDRLPNVLRELKVIAWADAGGYVVSFNASLDAGDPLAQAARSDVSVLILTDIYTDGATMPVFDESVADPIDTPRGAGQEHRRSWAAFGNDECPSEEGASPEQRISTPVEHDGVGYVYSIWVAPRPACVQSGAIPSGLIGQLDRGLAVADWWVMPTDPPTAPAETDYCTSIPEGERAQTPECQGVAG